MIFPTHRNRHATSVRRSLAISFLALASLALIPLSIAAVPPSGAVAAPAGVTTGACIDTSGVTVVVDFTDIGGQIEIGCASSDPATGRAALEAAGFTLTDSQSGLICAINANPNPCPATFEGSFWSYWHSSRDGEWTSYQVGADSSNPVAGELDGWRYNDGSAGPGVAPSAAAEAVTPPGGEDAETPVLPSPMPTPWLSINPTLLIMIGAGAVFVIAVIVLIVRSRRRRAVGGD